MTMTQNPKTRWAPTNLIESIEWVSCFVDEWYEVNSNAPLKPNAIKMQFIRHVLSPRNCGHLKLRLYFKETYELWQPQDIASLVLYDYTNSKMGKAFDAGGFIGRVHKRHVRSGKDKFGRVKAVRH